MPNPAVERDAAKARHPLNFTLGLMVRALRVLGGVLAALLAVMMFAFGVLAATSTHHTLRAHEREHLAAAVRFVRGHQTRTGEIPESAAFESWVREMDAKGFRFEGNGFTIDRRCGSNVDEFCIYFSTGDGFVTYVSWQKTMERVSFDDSPLPLAFGMVLAALAAATLSRFLLASRNTHSAGREAHEG